MAVRVPAGQTLHGSTYNPVTGVITYFGTGSTVGGTYDPGTGVSTALGGGFSGGGAGLTPEQQAAAARAQVAAREAALAAQRKDLDASIKSAEYKAADVSNAQARIDAINKSVEANAAVLKAQGINVVINPNGTVNVERSPFGQQTVSQQQALAKIQSLQQQRVAAAQEYNSAAQGYSSYLKESDLPNRIQDYNRQTNSTYYQATQVEKMFPPTNAPSPTVSFSRTVGGQDIFVSGQGVSPRKSIDVRATVQPEQLGGTYQGAGYVAPKHTFFPVSERPGYSMETSRVATMENTLLTGETIVGLGFAPSFVSGGVGAIGGLAVGKLAPAARFAGMFLGGTAAVATGEQFFLEPLQSQYHFSPQGKKMAAFAIEFPAFLVGAKAGEFAGGGMAQLAGMAKPAFISGATRFKGFAEKADFGFTEMGTFAKTTFAEKAEAGRVRFFPTETEKLNTKYPTVNTMTREQFGRWNLGWQLQQPPKGYTELTDQLLPASKFLTNVYKGVKLREAAELGTRNRAIMAFRKAFGDTTWSKENLLEIEARERRIANTKKSLPPIMEMRALKSESQLMNVEFGKEWKKIVWNAGAEKGEIAWLRQAARKKVVPTKGELFGLKYDLGKGLFETSNKFQREQWDTLLARQGAAAHQRQFEFLLLQEKKIRGMPLKKLSGKEWLKTMEGLLGETQAIQKKIRNREWKRWEQELLGQKKEKEFSSDLMGMARNVTVVKQKGGSLMLQELGGKKEPEKDFFLPESYSRLAMKLRKPKKTPVERYFGREIKSHILRPTVLKPTIVTPNVTGLPPEFRGFALKSLGFAGVPSVIKGATTPGLGLPGGFTQQLTEKPIDTKNFGSFVGMLSGDLGKLQRATGIGIAQGVLQTQKQKQKNVLSIIGTRTIVSPALRREVIPSTRQGTLQLQKQKELEKTSVVTLAIGLSPAIGIGTATAQRVAMREMEQLLTIARVKQKTRQREPNIFRMAREQPPEKPEKPKKSGGGGGWLPRFASGKRAAPTGFDVLLRRKGKWQTVGMGLEKTSALGLGSWKARSTLGRSFKIVPSARPGKFIPGFAAQFKPWQFRQPKSAALKGALVERSEFGLDLPTEVSEIKAAKRGGVFPRLGFSKKAKQKTKRR